MKNFTRLTLATTASANDSLLFGAVALDKVMLHAAELTLVSGDIEELNRATLARRYDVCKISSALYTRVERDYELLETGAVFCEKNGPLLLARPGLKRADLRSARILGPGASTTSAQLFQRWAPRGTLIEHRPGHTLLPALMAGECDAALLIDDGRFSQAARRFDLVIDLAAWWRAQSGLPAALSCYVIRRHLHERFAEPIEQLMRCALRVAERGDAEVAEYVLQRSCSHEDEAIRQHLAASISNLTRTLGRRGRDAILALTEGQAAAA